MDNAMRQTLPFWPSRPKPKDSRREKTSLSGRLPALSMVFEAPGVNRITAPRRPLPGLVDTVAVAAPASERALLRLELPPPVKVGIWSAGKSAKVSKKSAPAPGAALVSNVNPA